TPTRPAKRGASSSGVGRWARLRRGSPATARRTSSGDRTRTLMRALASRVVLYCKVSIPASRGRWASGVPGNRLLTRTILLARGGIGTPLPRVEYNVPEREQNEPACREHHSEILP